MALDLAPDALIRAGSGLLFALTSLLVLATSRGRRRNVGLGVLLLGFGGFFVLANLVDIYALALAAAILAAAGAIATLLWLRPLERREAAPLAVGLVLAGASTYAVALIGFASGAGGELVIVSTALVMTSVCTARAWSAADDASRRACLVLAGAFAPYVAYINGITVVRVAREPSLPLIALLGPAAIVLVAFTWIALGHRWRKRLPIALGCLILAFLVVGELRDAFLPQGGTRDVTGLIGIARTVGWTFLAWAILRHDLLGIDLRPVTVRRGSLAAAALATLFVIAQVAQNFFAAEYGLLMGGVVAGALLFAAQPLQRAMEERAPARAHATAAAPSPGASAEREEAFRHAVRFALRDRVLTPQERVHLAHVAEQLGLGARRAAEIEADVLGETPA